MAQSYDRRINLYINIDGKDVKNDVASIKAEMNKIVNAQARMTIGSKEYQAQAEKIKHLKGILDQHRQDITSIDKSWSLGKMGDSFNRYFSLITAGMASLVGLALSVRQVVQSFNDFEERLDNLSALTGLSGEDLDWLGQKAKDLSTATLESGIRVTYGAQQIVDAFTKTGSARPELLKNKEALVAVTTEAIILASAAKIELQPAIEGLTMVMNQYNVSATEARRIINTLGAGSKEGAGEIPYLTVGFEKVGTVASQAGLSIETLVAALETLAPRMTQPEIAGRGLKGVLLALQAGADDTNPKIVGFSNAIENLAKKNLTVTESMALFGSENITCANTLTANVKELKYYEQAVTDTNVAIEQAAINTDNNNSKLAQAKNRLNLMSIELGEKLAPALTISTSGLSYFIKAMSIMANFVSQNKVLLVTLLVSLIAYGSAIRIATIMEAGLNREKGIGLVITKLSIFWNRAASSAMLLYQAAVALLTGNITRATRAMQLFWAFSALNPVGLITAAVVGLGAALYFLSGRLTAAQKAQKMLNDMNVEAQKNIVEEKIKLETLMDLARDEKLSKMDRLKAIMQLNAISPKYLGGLTLENINTKAATESTKAYTESLLHNARAQAAKEKIIEIDKQLLDLQAGNIENISFLDKARVRLAEGFKHDYSAEKANTLIAAKAIEDLTKQKEKLVGIAKEQAVADLLTGGGGGDPINTDLIRAKELELELANKMPRSTEAEIVARNKAIETIQKEIDRLNALGTVKEGAAGEEQAKRDEKAIKKKMDFEEAAHNDEMSRINREHLDGKTTDDQYKADLLDEDLKFLAKKLTIYKVGSKEYKAAYNESLQKQVDAQKVVQDLLLKAQKGLADAGIENLKDGINKEKALQEQRFKEEIDALKKQLLEKAVLSDQEIALNDTINQTIEQKKITHLKAMADLDKAGALQKQMDAAIIDQAKAATDEEKYAAERELAQAQYDQDIQDANGNAAKIAQAERGLSDRLIQIKLDELDRRQQIGDAVFGAANTLFGALVDLAGKETALGKALFLFQQTAAIGQIIFNTGIANAKALAASPLTFGQPWVTINTITGAASIAAVVAQSIAGFSGGGYTGSGNKNEVAGQVHKDEYVVPSKVLNSPLGAALVANLEDMRTNPVMVTQAAVQASRSNRNSGCDASAAMVVNPSPNTPIDSGAASHDSELTNAINNMSRAVAILVKNGVQFPIVPFKKQLDEISDLIDQTGMGGFKK